jgi:hypothetical protein
MKVKQNNNKNEVDQEVVENASKFVQVKEMGGSQCMTHLAN